MNLWTFSSSWCSFIFGYLAPPMCLEKLNCTKVPLEITKYHTTEKNILVTFSQIRSPNHFPPPCNIMDRLWSIWSMAGYTGPTDDRWAGDVECKTWWDYLLHPSSPWHLKALRRSPSILSWEAYTQRENQCRCRRQPPLANLGLREGIKLA